MKKFPAIVHASFEEDSNGDEDYLAVYTDGINQLDAGRRVAIYKLAEEGTVHGPKAFVPKLRHKKVTR